MNPENFDPVAAAFCFDGANVPAEETEVPPDVIGQLFENAKFDAAMCAPGSATALAVESSGYTRKRQSDAPAEVDDAHRLEKGIGETSLVRRKRTLSAWMSGELALGKTARELIDHAARHDRETANLLREVADELDAD